MGIIEKIGTRMTILTLINVRPCKYLTKEQILESLENQNTLLDKMLSEEDLNDFRRNFLILQKLLDSDIDEEQ